MRAALALKAYQMEHGNYPVSLEELRAKGGWPIDNDPFTGWPLIYRREGNGFIIYSVGPDLFDNGGMDFQAARKRIEQLSREKKVFGWPYDRIQYDLPLRMKR